jgi:8-oxo-dGTP pyrophosphatase MutT (NUDIX family)
MYSAPAAAGGGGPSGRGSARQGMGRRRLGGKCSATARVATRTAGTLPCQHDHAAQGAPSFIPCTEALPRKHGISTFSNAATTREHLLAASPPLYSRASVQNQISPPAYSSARTGLGARHAADRLSCALVTPRRHRNSLLVAPGDSTMLCAVPCVLPCGLDDGLDGGTSDVGTPAALLPWGPPPPLLPRPRSDHQLWSADDGARLLAGCIPYRSGGGGAPEVLLITSRRGKGWGIPKGGWEDDERVEAAAQRETIEEAGVRGVIEVGKRRGRVRGRRRLQTHRSPQGHRQRAPTAGPPPDFEGPRLAANAAWPVLDGHAHAAESRHLTDASRPPPGPRPVCPCSGAWAFSHLGAPSQRCAPAAGATAAASPTSLPCACARSWTRGLRLASGSGAG